MLLILLYPPVRALALNLQPDHRLLLCRMRAAEQ